MGSKKCCINKMADAWKPYINNALATGAITNICIMGHNAAICGEGPPGTFHPCAYEADTVNDAGVDIKVNVNEQTDVINSIRFMKKPQYGWRFCGKKYIPCGGTPRNEPNKVKTLLAKAKPGGNPLISCAIITLLLRRVTPVRSQR